MTSGTYPRKLEMFLDKYEYPEQLAWRIPGTAEPGGLPSMGSHRVGQRNNQGKMGNMLDEKSEVPCSNCSKLTM